MPQHALWCEQAEEEEEEEEEAAAPKKKKGGGSKGWGSVYLNPPLNDFMGVESCPRSDVVKEIWRHVKEHNLQLPTDKRFIICDVDGPEGAARLPRRARLLRLRLGQSFNLDPVVGRASLSEGGCGKKHSRKGKEFTWKHINLHRSMICHCRRNGNALFIPFLRAHRIADGSSD